MAEFIVATCIVASIVVCGITAFLMHCIKNWPLYKLGFSLPGPRALPIFGNALLFRGDGHAIMESFAKLFGGYSSPFRIWLGPQLDFYTNDPDQMKVILLSNKTVEKHSSYEFLRPVVGEGLVTAPVEKWMLHRKLIAPTLNTVLIRSFIPIFHKHAKLLVDRLRPKVNGPEFNVLPQISMYTLSTVIESIFGVEQQAESGNLVDYAEALIKSIEISFKRIVSVWLHPDCIFNLTQMGKVQKNNVTSFRNLAADLIRQTRDAHLDNKGSGQANTMSNDDGSLPRRKTFLNQLMGITPDQGHLSDEALLDEAATMIAAGHETVATTCCFMILMLASHPAVQEKVYQELREIYQDDFEREVTTEDTSRMVYMEQVIKETMRLFPGAPLVARKAMENTNIGPVTLPKGACIFLGIFFVHRDAKHWPDPLTFDPDRFLPEEVAKRHSHCYLPFLSGPRNCPGAKFAMTSMKVFLAVLLRAYVVKKEVITRISDMKLAFNTVIQPTEEITVAIEQRE